MAAKALKHGDACPVDGGPLVTTGTLDADKGGELFRCAGCGYQTRFAPAKSKADRHGD